MPNVALTATKGGSIFVLNRDFLGGQAQGPSNGDGVPQRIDSTGQGFYNTFAPWPGDGHLVYIVPGGPNSQPDGLTYPLTAYHDDVTGGSADLQPCRDSHEIFGYSSSSPVVTSNGTTPGSAVVWVVNADNAAGKNGILRAYDAVPHSGTLNMLNFFPIGRAAKFTRPYVSGGYVYVGTRDVGADLNNDNDDAGMNGHVYGFG